MGTIVQLQNKVTGENQYPRTYTTAVIDENATPLSTLMEQQDDKITELATKTSELTSSSFVLSWDMYMSEANRGAILIPISDINIKNTISVNLKNHNYKYGITLKTKQVVNGYATYDSGWQNESKDFTLYDKELTGVKYLSIVFTNLNETETPSYDEILSIADISILGRVELIEQFGLNVDSSLDKLNLLNSADINESMYDIFSSDGLSRGFIAIPAKNLSSKSRIKLKVNDDSNIKCALHLRNNTNFNITAIYDSGYKNPGEEVVISLNINQSEDVRANYIIVFATDISTGTLAPSYEEIISSISIEFLDSVVELSSELSELSQEVKKYNVVPIEESMYYSYGSSGTLRGVIAIPTTTLSNNSRIRLYVKSSSKLSVALHLRNSKSFEDSAIYDSGYKQALQSVETELNKNQSSDKKANYIILFAKITDDESVAPTFEEIMNSIEFSFLDGVTPFMLQAYENKATINNMVCNMAISEDMYLSSDTRGGILIPIEHFSEGRILSVRLKNVLYKYGVQIKTKNVISSYAIWDSGWQYNSNRFDLFPLITDKVLSIAIVFTDVETSQQPLSYDEIMNIAEIEVLARLDATEMEVKELASRTSIFTSQLRAKTNLTFIAHRGVHINGIPENSLDAYRYAGYCGFDYAETDFCSTADGELVLMHDGSINRTMRNKSDYSELTETVNVVDKTLAELRENYVLISSDPRMRRPIPTLEEYFTTCKHSGVFPIPEIKTIGITNEQIKKAYELGKRIMGEGNFGFCSFSSDFLDYARSLSEKTLLLYINGGVAGTINSITGKSRESEYTWWYPAYINYGLDEESVIEHKNAGVKVAVWTVPVSQVDNLLKMGVDCLAGDELCPNIDKVIGAVVKSDVDFSSFVTDGIVENKVLKLSSGQTISFTADYIWIGGYYLSVIGKGNFKIRAPRLSTNISSEKTDRYIYQGFVDDYVAKFTISATEDSEIEFIEFSAVKF